MNIGKRSTIMLPHNPHFVSNAPAILAVLLASAPIECLVLVLLQTERGLSEQPQLLAGAGRRPE
jgi:hypothetical protein